MAVDDARVEHRSPPAPLRQTDTEEARRETIHDGQVIVEPHASDGDASPAGRHHRVGDKPDRLVQRHALGASPFGRDAVHRGRLQRDLTAGVDETRPAVHDDAVENGDQRVGHGDVVEAVDTGRLEVEPEHLAGRPRTHEVELGSRM